jgi:hypothetical protein
METASDIKWQLNGNFTPMTLRESEASGLQLYSQYLMIFSIDAR